MKKRTSLIAFALVAAAVSLMPDTGVAQETSRAGKGGVRSGGGGGVVVRNGERFLADYVLKARWEPYVIEKNVAAELMQLRRMATILDLDLGDEFWACGVFNWTGFKCKHGPVEYRIVPRLPVEVLSPVKLNTGDVVHSYGYTSGGDTRHITNLNEQFLLTEDVTEKALALIHERLHASNPAEEHIAWYTHGLKILRLAHQGKKPLTPDGMEFVRRYTHTALLALTGTAQRTTIHDFAFSNIDDGKCVVFTKSEMPSDALKIEYHQAGKEQPIPCRGFFRADYLNVNGRDNTLRLKVEDQDDLVSFWNWKINVSIDGEGNQVWADARFPRSTHKVEIVGSENVVNDEQPVTIRGKGNTVQASPVTVEGDGNEVRESTSPEGRIEIRGSRNMITRSRVKAVRGSGNTLYQIQPTQLKVDGDNNVARFDEITYCAGNACESMIEGDGNQLINTTGSFAVAGGSNVVRNTRVVLGITGSGNNIIDNAIRGPWGGPSTVFIEGSRNEMRNNKGGIRVNIKANDCKLLNQKIDGNKLGIGDPRFLDVKWTRDGTVRGR